MTEIIAERLVRDYADTVTRIGYTWFGNTYDAQDICQTVLLKLLTKDTLPQGADEARRWVVRCAINECKNLKKSAWFRRTVPLTEGLELLTAVQALPQKYREVIFLHYYEGYAVAEISELLGRSPALISTHLTRARVRLRKLLGGTEYASI